MNSLQFQTALLEAQQRARLAIDSFMEAMTPPNIGVQNASDTNPIIEQGLQDQANGLGGNSPEQGNVPAGDIYNVPGLPPTPQ